MPEKKYQIFLSSTFSDLKEERQAAIKTILDLNQIPSGMESFPAIDMEQFSYIAKVIDECDYYCLIIAGRYGSVSGDGVSFTEKEFDYAVSRGKQVIALIHDDVGNIPSRFVEKDDILRGNLASFRDRVCSGRVVRYWRDNGTLQLAIFQGVTAAMNTFPAVGWIRGDAAASDVALQQINDLRNERDNFKEALRELQASLTPILPDVAQLDDFYSVSASWTEGSHNYKRKHKEKIPCTWRELFFFVGAHFVQPSTPSKIEFALKQLINAKRDTWADIDETEWRKVRAQLIALGLLRSYTALATGGGGVTEFLQLTELGNAELIKSSVIRKPLSNTNHPATPSPPPA